MEKKLDDNYIRMLQVILNKSWRQHPTKQQLYGHLPEIKKTIQIRRTRQAGHCWRRKDKRTHKRCTPVDPFTQKSKGWTTSKNLYTACSLEDLPGAIDDRDGWQERVKEICAGSVTRWWWQFNLTLYIYIYNPYQETGSNILAWIDQPTTKFLFFFLFLFKWNIINISYSVSIISFPASNLVHLNILNNKIKMIRRIEIIRR